jgi:hypothetical protein
MREFDPFYSSQPVLPLAALCNLRLTGPEIRAFRAFDFVSRFPISQSREPNCRKSPALSAEIPVLRRLSAETGSAARTRNGFQACLMHAKQAAECEEYGTSIKCTHEGLGPAVLRIPNIKNGTINFESLKFTAKSNDLNEDFFVLPGDLLLIRTNGSKELIGRAAVVTESLRTRSSFASYLVRFRLLGDETLWSWVGLTWSSDMIRSNIESRAATTAGQYNISLSGLADLAIPLPTTAEQKEITREVQHRLAAADRLEITLDRQLERARTTRESLLREAFSGRLVPQDAKDEPASVLLERVHTARKSEDQKPKAKRMPKVTSKKKAGTQRSLIDVLRESGRSMTPEQLFEASGYSEDSVDEFFAELREYTAIPAKIVEERTSKGLVRLKAAP